MRLKRKPLPRRGRYLGGGHFSTVYEVSPSRVLKVCLGGYEIRRSNGAYNPRGECDGPVMDAGLEWALYCMKAWRDNPAGSTALRHLPRVYEVGLTDSGYWVLMERLEAVHTWDMAYTLRLIAERACLGLFGHNEVDMHLGNVMRCPRTGRTVITDPFAHTSAVAYKASRSLKRML